MGETLISSVLLLIVTIVLHRVVSKEEMRVSPIFLYLPLTLLFFFPIFNTHHLIWLFPGFVWITQELAERKLFKEPLIYGYFFVVAVYLLARMQPEPRLIYMLFAGTAWLFTAVSLKVVSDR